MAHVSKQVPGEPTKQKQKTRKGTIRNIIFAIIGSLLLGLGCDMRICTFIFVGLMTIFISMILAISDSDT